VTTRLHPIPIHYCWVQGIGELPAAHRENLRRWQELLPPDFVLMGWDDAEIRAASPFYAAHADAMSHHAMRADVTLLHAQIHHGGLVIGTDMAPNNPAGLFDLMRRSEGFLIRDRNDCVYNGMSFAGSPGHPVFHEIAAAIRSTPGRFVESLVPYVTGPMRWTQVLRHMDHGLGIVCETEAWTRSYWESSSNRPHAWVDPGFAASHARS